MEQLLVRSDLVPIFIGRENTKFHHYLTRRLGVERPVSFFGDNKAMIVWNSQIMVIPTQDSGTGQFYELKIDDDITIVVYYGIHNDRSEIVLFLPEQEMALYTLIDTQILE